MPGPFAGGAGRAGGARAGSGAGGAGGGSAIFSGLDRANAGQARGRTGPGPGRPREGAGRVRGGARTVAGGLGPHGGPFVAPGGACGFSDFSVPRGTRARSACSGGSDWPGVHRAGRWWSGMPKAGKSGARPGKFGVGRPGRCRGGPVAAARGLGADGAWERQDDAVLCARADVAVDVAGVGSGLGRPGPALTDPERRPRIAGRRSDCGGGDGLRLARAGGARISNSSSMEHRVGTGTNPAVGSSSLEPHARNRKMRSAHVAPTASQARTHRRS